MRKILLTLSVALSVATISAQALSTRLGDYPSAARYDVNVPMQEETIDLSDAPEAPQRGAFFITQNDFSERSLDAQISQEEMATFTPALTLTSTRSSIKDAELKTSYTGYGDDYRSSTTVSWTMSTGTATNSSGSTVDVLIDVIPNYFSSSMDNVPVEYTLSSGVITIPAQIIGTTSTYYIFLCSSKTDDGSIVMTLNDDGSLTTTSGDRYLYGAFTTTTYDPSFTLVRNGGTYGGYYEIEDDPVYYYEGQTVTPEAEIEPENMYMCAVLSYTGTRKTNSLAMVPAYSTMSFKNYTDEPTGLGFEYEWAVKKLSYNSSTSSYDTEKTITSNDTDFTYETESGVYGDVNVTATYGTESDTYSWGVGLYRYADASHYAYAGKQMSSLAMSNGSLPLMGRSNYDFGYSYYSYLGTPDINKSSYSINRLIIYQGIPTAPIYITGINYMVRAAEFVDTGITLTCRIREAVRSSSGTLALGDTIAESTTLSYLTGSSLISLEFTNFYKYDEDGMTVGLDYMFIDKEFAVEFDGWDNGTFTCYPYGEYTGYKNNGLTSTYCYFTDATSLSRFPNLYAHQWVGFLGLVYGYLHTEDSTDISFGADGGSVTLNVEPFMCTNSNGSYTTRLYLDDDSEIPDWVTTSIANEDYSDDWNFDLIITAEELPSGVDERSCSFRLYQEGACLDITITQSESGGISTTVADASKSIVTVDGDIIRIDGDVDGAELYSVAGQKVGQGTSEIDASALSAGVYVVKLSDGTAVKVVK